MTRDAEPAHEGRAQPHPEYGRAALRSWVRRLQQGFADTAEVFVYFNNDPDCHAIYNAFRLRDLLSGVPGLV